MLEKNKKNYADGLFFTKNEAINSVEAETDNSCIFYDAHFHLYHCIDAGDKADGKNNDAEYIRSYIKKIHGISCSQTFSEWEQNRNFIQSVESSNFTTDKGISDGTNLFTNKNIINAAGLHPYDISAEKTDECDAFIQRLFTECEKENIHAIGETGFDFFTNELKLQEDLQDKYFLLQLEPAQKYNLPLIIHCRKAVHKIFQHSAKLANLPSVLMHSFLGNSTEALNLAKKIHCCYFSFGGLLFRGSKKAQECLMTLPLEKILLETDAPYQPQKNRTYSTPQDIITVYKKAYEIIRTRDDAPKTFYDFTMQIEKNYKAFTKSIQTAAL